jgi:fucose permease
MSTPTTPSFFSPAVVTVYAAGLMQGLTLVSFPVLSSVLTQGLGFTDAEYGAIFLPQVALTVVGAIGGGSLARRVGLKPLLIAALLANAVSQVLLAAGAWAGAGAFLCVMAGTATLGFGFGLLGAPINSFPPMFFPRQPHASVVAAHTLLGLGLSVGPLIAGVLVSMGAWYGFPLLLAALCGVLALGTLATALPAEHRMTAGQTPETGRPVAAIQFWIFAGITVLYAFAEGTFANWAVIYLNESKGLTMMTAGLALSVFWGALVAGRLLVTALVTRVPPTAIWASLPVLMIAAFLSLPYASGAYFGIGLFGLAGLACSAFFPLTITLLSNRFPSHVAWVSSMMIAALMVGVGVGSFAIGALRELLSLEDLYRLSAIYPAAVLALAMLVLRTARTPVLAPQPR